MSLYKETKDKIGRILLGNDVVPVGLSDLHHYFRLYKQINFKFEPQEDGSFVAISTDFNRGSIITSAKNIKQLDSKIEDAILTAFEVPSSYAKDAAVKKVSDSAYAFA